MFENIIGQEATIQSLSAAIMTRQLPPSLLFHGPAFSGKLSTALEIARVLSCTGKKGWNCGCHACERQRLLIHPNLLLLGSRDYTTEIAAAADVLQRTGKLFARYMFIRAVRKQLKGFDPVLWEGEANIKIKGFQPTIQACEEIINSLHPDLPLPGDKALTKLLTDTKALTAKLAASSRSDNIPISQIRRAIFWTHHSSAAGKKIIIIENADGMLDSSRNSLLKVLEEPSEELTIILLTTRKGAIIRTILSRVRPYLFLERTEEESRIILNQIFRNKATEFTTLRDYFLAWKDLNPLALKKLARSFLQLLLGPQNEGQDLQEELQELYSSPSPREAVVSFFEELFLLFSQILHAKEEHPFRQRIGLTQIESWTKILHQAIYHLQQLNLNPKNMVETVYYQMALGLPSTGEAAFQTGVNL